MDIFRHNKSDHVLMQSYYNSGRIKYPGLAVIGTFLGLYILFTEFMLPNNYVFLPRISLIVSSFSDVYTLYPFRSAFLDTFISVLVAVLAAYFSFKIIGIGIVYLAGTVNAIRYLNIFYKYTPAVFLMAVPIMFFEYSYLMEIIVLMIILIFRFSGVIFNSLDNIPPEILDSYRTMSEPTFRFHRKVLWRYALADIKKSLPGNFRVLWGYAIIYEVIGKSVGLGSLLQLMIDYKDYYGMLSVIVFLSFIIYLGMKVIEQLVNKTTFWERQ